MIFLLVLPVLQKKAVNLHRFLVRYFHDDSLNGIFFAG
jgi:hypothetical protein